MKRRIFVLLALLLLPSCTSAQETPLPADEPEASMVSEPAPAPEASALQESDSTPADAAQAEPEKTAEPAVIQADLSTLPELDLGEPETRSAEEYYAEVDREKSHQADGWGRYRIALGCYINTISYRNGVVCDENALYLYWASQTDGRYLEGICKLADGVKSSTVTRYRNEMEIMEYGCSGDSVFLISTDGKRLERINLRTRTVETVFQTEGELSCLDCGWNVLFFAEKAAEKNYSVYRLYAPEMKLGAIESGLSGMPYAGAAHTFRRISLHELLISWKNPEYERIAADTEWCWEHYYNQSGNNPYPGKDSEAYLYSDFEEHLPGQIYDEFGTVYGWDRYRDTQTGQCWTVAYVPVCGIYPHYYLMDGTRWYPSEDMEDDSGTLCFWLYLPPDDAS